ncbi:hypothetical protein Pst134EB_008334 [Puccinia striiformis f. sp. tritici]|nr:hypothetical protein Pst134EB_008334 [Puccinia striiformis f. sp. tritici]
MWIGLCTIPLMLLVTGVRSYDRGQIDGCFQKNLYAECIKQYAPNCKNIPLEKFGDCCPESGIPKTGLGCTGVPAPEKPLGGCGAVSGEYYQACLDKYDPGCKYVPIDDYQNCCTGEIGHKKKTC